METYSSEQENQSDDSGHVQHAATVSEGTDRLSQSSSDDRTSNTEECHIASHPHCTRTGSESSLHDKQLAFWLRHGIATLSSNGPLDKIHLSGDLLCSLGYKDDSSRSFCPLHMECQGLDCQGLPRSRGGSWDKDERWPDIRVIKHKPSAINFPDFPHSSQSSSSDAPVCEVSGTETSSSEGEDDDNDDVFTDLPQYHTYFNGAYRKGSTQRTRYREEVASPQDLAHGENFTARSEKKANEHGMEKKQKGARTSHWSESMSCLMSKLDQLNIDIEDALSTGSSPASTPSTKRRNKVSSSSDAENPMDRNVHGKGLRRSSRVGYRDLKGLTSSEFAGTRPKEDSAMRSLRRWKEKAGKSFYSIYGMFCFTSNAKRSHHL
ncbi:uncharacterized protein [Ambystoma mexicanum]|uniref:uncharacterized protein n=1 Tax=Ambystoma mexicanum TaxID=8296 RepID=UPI0037E90002